MLIFGLHTLDRDTPEPAAGIFGLHTLDRDTPEPESIELAESIHASGAPRLEEQHSGLAQSEISAFLNDTLQSFAEFLIERVADAHGMTVLYHAVKLVYGAYKWEQVAEDGGGMEILAPLPLGHNLVLDAAFHLGGDPDTPAITVGLAPDGESGVGALAVGKLEIDPDPSHAGVASIRPESGNRFGPVQVVACHLPASLRNSLEPAAAAAAARRAAGEELRPRLLPERQRLRDAGVKLILGCDPEQGLALWERVGDTGQRESAVITTADGQLKLELVPDAVDLVIGREPEIGLTVSLRSRDSEESVELITWSAPDHPQMAEQDEEAGVAFNTLQRAGTFSPEAGAEGSAGLAADQGSTAAGEGAAQPAAGPPSIAGAQSVRLTRLERVPVTSVWPSEADHFTPWLLQHGTVLSAALGIDIELQLRGDNAGQLSTDVIGREVTTGSFVVIEKQYGSTDHLHLGRILTFVAAIKPTTVVWIAEEFREEHRAALNWLNDHTDPTIHFYGVQLRVVTLVGAPAGLVAPILQVTVEPRKK